MRTTHLPAWRMALAILEGAVVGGLSTALFLMLLSGGEGRLYGIAPVAGAIAFLIWLTGMTVIGVPVWLLLQKLGAHSKMAAMTTGFVLTVLAVLAFDANKASREINDVASFVERYWQSGNLTEHGMALLSMSALLGGMGIVVGLTVWYASYGRHKQDQH